MCESTKYTYNIDNTCIQPKLFELEFEYPQNYMSIDRRKCWRHHPSASVAIHIGSYSYTNYKSLDIELRSLFLVRIFNEIVTCRVLQKNRFDSIIVGKDEKKMRRSYSLCLRYINDFKHAQCAHEKKEMKNN